MSELQVIGIDEARAKGLTHYFTGKPCKSGHISERYVCQNVCVECMRIRDSARRVHKATDALVISAGDAALRGMTLYFTGKPCIRGHVAPRRVINSNCVECERERQAKVAERQRVRRSKKLVDEDAVGGGFIGRNIREPHVAWPDDGGVRREVVTDPNWIMPNGQPRVVRKIGWRACMCCTKRFFSQDMTKIRLCDYCKKSKSGDDPFDF